MDHIGNTEPQRQPWARFVTNIMMCNPKDLSTKKTCELLQMTDVELSKKLSYENTSAQAIKDWILKEMAERAMSEQIPEQWVCDQFGYSRGDYRARLRRRGIDNPWQYSQEQVDALMHSYGPMSRQK